MIRSTTRVTTLLAVGVLVLTGCSGGGEDPAPSPSQEAPAVSDGGSAGPAPSASEPTGEGDDEVSECKTDDSDQEIPTEAPQPDAWPSVNGIGIPVSDTYGPTQRDGDVWTCFSHSPTGALYAAAYIRPLTGDPRVLEEYLSDGSPAEESSGSSVSGIALRGYKFTAHDEDSVSVELVYEAAADGESGLVAFPVTVHWEDEQWTVRRADFETYEPRQVTGLTGYTPWSVGA